MNEVKELVEELRNKKSRDNRDLFDRSADMIEKLAKELCEKSGCHHKCNDTKDCVVEDEAKAIIGDNLPSVLTNEEKVSKKEKQSEWISVEDRLPEASGYYLICQKSDLWCGEIIQTARWNKTERIFRGAQAGCFMEYVTHWMPLPEAPKMKGGE